MGFVFINDTYERWVEYCKEYENQFRQYLNSNISQDIKDYINLCLNPTKENYRKAGLFDAKGKYIMYDKGTDHTYTNMFGYTSTYYYKGIKLQDSSMNIEERPYYYESNGSNKENRAGDEGMYYLQCK